MRVILTDDVVGVGDIGELVRVKAGYARNFLVPRGLAMEVGSSSAKMLAHRSKQLEAKKKRMKVAAQTEADKLSGTGVEVELRVGTGGKVFGSIHGRDIAEKLKLAGFEVDRRRVLLSEPIRKLGDHQVKVKLHADVVIMVKVTVKGVAATKEQEEQETQQARQAIEEATSKRQNKDAEEATDEEAKSETES
jgi:large subunit ribosomal protein L9